MRLLTGLLTYLVAVIALVGFAAAFLFSAVEPAVTKVAAPQDARTVAPRIQMWLDRKAEGLVYAERRKAAALAEEEQAKELRMKVRSRADSAFARARDEEIQSVERENAARMRDNAKREAKRQSRELRDAEYAGSPRAVQGQASQYYPDLHGRIF